MRGGAMVDVGPGHVYVCGSQGWGAGFLTLALLNEHSREERGMGCGSSLFLCWGLQVSG